MKRRKIRCSAQFVLGADVVARYATARFVPADHRRHVTTSHIGHRLYVCNDPFTQELGLRHRSYATTDRNHQDARYCFEVKAFEGSA
jgi:hypothetical protein